MGGRPIAGLVVVRLDQCNQFGPRYQGLHLSEEHTTPSEFAEALKSSCTIGCCCKSDLLLAPIIGSTASHNKTGKYEEWHLISVSLDRSC